MKTFYKTIPLLISIVFLYSCSKDIPENPEKVKAETYLEDNVLSENLSYNKSITVFDNNNKSSIELLISATDENLLKYYLESFDYSISIVKALDKASFSLFDVELQDKSNINIKDTTLSHCI
jgi:hypothetical protein